MKNFTEAANNLGIKNKLTRAKEILEMVSADDYLKDLNGTIGADPLVPHYMLATTKVM